jgi:hypothetical protein
MALNMWKKTAAALVLSLAVAAPAMAQMPEPSMLGVGVGLLKWSDFEQWAKGIVVDFAKPVGENNLSVIADLFVGKDGDETDMTIGGGVRWTAPGDARAKVYAQAALGVARWSVDGFSDSGFYVAPGVGVRAPINDAVGFRAQVDFYLPNWDWGNLYRIAFLVDINLNR